MAMKLYPDTAVQAIANAIRAKNGSNDTYSIGEMAQAINDLPSGTSAIGPYTQVATGTVTFTSRYQTTGNRLITSLANIGFTPKQFLLIATAESLADIRSALVGGTESNAVMFYADFVQFSDGTHAYYARSMSRLSTQGTVSGAKANSAWTSQTNNYLYNNGTNIYYRTASNYGILANTTYDWIALA